MPGKYFLVDTTRCTGCRGCQVACQQWNRLPAPATRQTGGHQNPPGLAGGVFRVVTFREGEAGGEPNQAWRFVSEACRHCLDPSCKQEADQTLPGAIEVAPSGAVIFTPRLRELAGEYQAIRDACPWDIPQLDPAGGLTKCHMCHERVRDGRPPACAAACPSGALVFGDEAPLKRLAAERLAAARQRFGPGARIEDQDDVRALYLVVAPPPRRDDPA